MNMVYGLEVTVLCITFQQLSLRMSRKYKVAAYLDDGFLRWDFFCPILGKRYRRELEISEYVYKVNKQPTVLDKIVTTSGALLK